MIASQPIIRTPFEIRWRVASAVIPGKSVLYRSSVLYAPAPVWIRTMSRSFSS